MKLSNPRTVQSNINDQRKADIDNGLKLARKVDSLRESVLEEEHKLELHRTVVTQEVQRQIDSKIEERDDLERELVPLRNERKELLVSLDAEWEKVNNQKSLIEKEKASIKEEKLKALNATKLAEDSLKRAETEENRIKDKSVVTKQESEEAHSKLLEAKKCLSDAKENEKQVNLSLDKRRLEIKEEEETLQATLLSISLREQELEASERFIAEEKVRLQDMRETLERALARTNK